MKYRKLIAALAALLALTGALGAAGAEPANNPHALHFEATCDGEPGSYIEPPSNVVAFKAGSTERTIIHEAEYEVLLIGEFGELPIDHVHETTGAPSEQKRGLDGRLVECTFDMTFPTEFLSEEEWEVIQQLTDIGPEDADGVRVVGTAHVMPTPAGPRAH